MHDVTSVLHDLLANHGVNHLTTVDGWLSTDGGYPACRASTDKPQFRDGGCNLRLDIEVALPGNRLMIESFSDFGTDANAAFRASLQNFCTGTLHVMLSALWGISDADQVLREKCWCGQQEWDLHIGNLVRKAAGGIDVRPPEDLMSVFDKLIQQLSLPPAIHWGRIYYANIPGRESIVEVLIDNEMWPAGEVAIRNASWPRLDVFYSTRLFWIMFPSLIIIPQELNCHVYTLPPMF